MARLPSGDYLIQMLDDQVILFAHDTEAEIVRFDPADTDEAAKAQNVIAHSDLSPEDRCFAHFWSGYFFAHARGAAADGYR